MPVTIAARPLTLVVFFLWLTLIGFGPLIVASIRYHDYHHTPRCTGSFTGSSNAPCIDEISADACGEPVPDNSRGRYFVRVATADGRTYDANVQSQEVWTTLSLGRLVEAEVWCGRVTAIRNGTSTYQTSDNPNWELGNYEGFAAFACIMLALVTFANRRSATAAQSTLRPRKSLLPKRTMSKKPRR
jgi:hypothetical protein